MQKNYINNFFLLVGLIAGTVISFTSIPSVVFADDAIMVVSPPVGSYRVYDDVTLRVLFSSHNKMVKTVLARLTYDPAAMTVTHVSTEGSPITSWDGPTVDAVLGEISFGGWLAKPKVLNKDVMLTLRVRPERIGEMTLIFEEGEINEFSSTSQNLLTGFSSGKFRISPEEHSEVEVESVEVAQTPLAAVAGEVLGAATATPTLFLSSETHPDQGAWYTSSTAVIAISFPKETNSIRLGLDRSPDGRPGVRYAPPIYEKTIADLEDGVWYFHAEIDGQYGPESANYRLQIDRKKPTDASLSEVPGADTADPNREFLVGANDEPSGVSSYAFFVDGISKEIWHDDGSHRYRLRVNSQGDHTLRMKPIDKAGNTGKEKEVTFTVGYLAAPLLILQNTAPKEGDELQIEINGTPNAEVGLVIKRGGEQAITEKIKTDDKGTALFMSKASLELGEYRVFANAHDVRGAVSEQSGEINFSVAPSFFGILSRHPGVLVAVLIVALFAWFLRRVLRGLREELILDTTLGADGVTVSQSNTIGRDQRVPLDQVVLHSRSPVFGVGDIA